MLTFHFETDELDGDLLIVDGARYVAEILGRDREFRYERRFIKTRHPPCLNPRLENFSGDPVGDLRPLRIVLQDCAPLPIFLDVAEEKPFRGYWIVNKMSIWAVLPVSEKRMRAVLATGRTAPTRAQAAPSVPEEPRRRFHLRREA